MFLNILGQNGVKTKTRSEAVLKARDAMRARAEAGSPEMHGLFFPTGSVFIPVGRKHIQILCLRPARSHFAEQGK